MSDCCRYRERLKQPKLPISLHRCTSLQDLPSNISTMFYDKLPKFMFWCVDFSDTPDLDKAFIFLLITITLLLQTVWSCFLLNKETIPSQISGRTCNQSIFITTNNDLLVGIGLSEAPAWTCLSFFAQLFTQSHSQSITQSVNHSVSQSLSQAITQSVIHSVWSDQ